MLSTLKSRAIALLALALLALIVSLLTTTASGPLNAQGGQELRGRVRVDGSSTVYPVTAAIAEDFGALQPRIRVTVGLSGTGGGFKKFVIGETDINDASRPIKELEVKACREHKIDFMELPVAFDGLSVLVNPKNDWCDSLTVEELKRIWEPESQVNRWSDIRPGWPDQPLRLYGPDHDSGTFDYFTEAICGKSRASRSDYTPSADDNVLVTGVSNDEYALGYFGFAYYRENADKLKLVAVDGGQGPVEPTVETIGDGSYSPLSRPIFIYVSSAAYNRAEVKEFVRYYLANATEIVPEVGYVPLPPAAYGLALYRFERGVVGSVFNDRAPGSPIEGVLKRGLTNRYPPVASRGK